MSRLARLSFLVGAAVAAPASTFSALGAQVRASERGTVSQTVDGTTITVEYSRPVGRGRDSLFGRVVRWGQAWTPGANWATTLEVDRDVQLDGQAVARGKYSMWIIPRAEGDWTLFLSTRHRAFHTQRPDPKDAALTVAITPRIAPHTEVLTWSFPAVSADGTTLQLQWGTTLVAVRLSVAPSRVAARGERDFTRYAGRYRVQWEDGQPETFVQIFAQDGRLRGRFDPAPPDDDAEFDLVPAGNQEFTPRYYRNGRVHEVDQETLVIFNASGFEMRFDNKSYARGTRIS